MSVSNFLDFLGINANIPANMIWAQERCRVCGGFGGRGIFRVSGEFAISNELQNCMLYDAMRSIWIWYTHDFSR